MMSVPLHSRSSKGAHTMGSECRAADWNSGDADGIARSALTIFAPALWPAMVIFCDEPPKLGITTCKKARAFMTSLTARLYPPLGCKNPN